ncbi:hypothetical protein WJX84_008770 [Apatococcus fuscideae]|uniref:RecA family profile 1 domain-containing protein n=1 Tax=Apatococcus fuscideae TaxID=2026836 RepID=A0AAW1SUE8_9CHLO
MPRAGQLDWGSDVDAAGLALLQDVSVEEILLRGKFDLEHILSATASAQADKRFQQLLQQHVAPRVQNGAQVMLQLQQQVNILPTGCSSLDDLLKGGLREGHMIELTGEPASGKSQACLLAAVTTAARGERVEWLDTSTFFNAHHAAAFYHALPASPHKLPLEACLDAIRVHPVQDALDALSILEAVMLQEQESRAARGPQPRQGRVGRLSLIVVDSVSALMGPVLGSGQYGYGQALLTSLGHTLKQAATSLSVVCLNTNGVVGGRQSGPRPALGETWRVQPQIRLQLHREEGQRRWATLLASTISPSGGRAWFQLTPTGPQTCAVPSGSL